MNLSHDLLDSQSTYLNSLVFTSTTLHAFLAVSAPQLPANMFPYPECLSMLKQNRYKPKKVKKGDIYSNLFNPKIAQFFPSMFGMQVLHVHHYSTPLFFLIISFHSYIIKHKTYIQKIIFQFILWCIHAFIIIK